MRELALFFLCIYVVVTAIQTRENIKRLHNHLHVIEQHLTGTVSGMDEDHAP